MGDNSPPQQTLAVIQSAQATLSPRAVSAMEVGQPQMALRRGHLVRTTMAPPRRACGGKKGQRERGARGRMEEVSIVRVCVNLSYFRAVTPLTVSVHSDQDHRHRPLPVCRSARGAAVDDSAVGSGQLVLDANRSRSRSQPTRSVKGAPSTRRGCPLELQAPRCPLSQGDSPVQSQKHSHPSALRC